MRKGSISAKIAVKRSIEFEDQPLSNNTSVPSITNPILIVICGPTATGKSGLALNLAQRLHSVILSADSRQVYREFDIGTAKPTAAEQRQVPHYLIDICDPTETLTVADYQQQVQQILSLLHPGRPLTPTAQPERINSGYELKTGHSSLRQTPLCLLVGGTGLYIRSITRGLRIPRVSPQPELRSQLTHLGQKICYVLLQQVDPVASQKIHPNDAVRTLRALEVFYVTGQPISAQQGEFPPAYPILQIGLDCLAPAAANQPDPLTHRIQQRTDQMVAMGLVDEVASLCRKYGEDLPLLNTLGYQEIRQYLRGNLSLAEAKALTVLHTRQFAKRQRTWFRADPTIEWWDCSPANPSKNSSMTHSEELAERIWQRVQAFIAQVENTENPACISPSSHY